MPEYHVIQSPLESWKGSISLPLPDEFSGIHWLAWKDAVNRPKRKAYALTHLYCYCGLELLESAGEWGLDIPLGDVRAWEDDPEKERIKLVSWLGREFMSYMDSIMDPKG